MADVAEGQRSSSELVQRWRPPLETAALILLAALAVSIVGGIVGAVFRPNTEGWLKLNALGFNMISTWHVAVLMVAVGLVLALRLPFAPDARGAATARLVLLDVAVLGAVIAICAVIGVIGTLGTGGRVFEVTWPEKIGDILELLGGGAVAVVAVLLALRGQSLIPVPERPAPAAAPAPRLRRPPPRHPGLQVGRPTRSGVTSGATGTAAVGPTRSRTARLRAPIHPLERVAVELERVTRIELASPAWKAGALPLSYTRAAPAP